MLGIKRVENRNMRPVPEKGRCAVSCSKSFTKEQYGAFVEWASRGLSPSDFELIPSWSEVTEWPGKIVGCVDYSCRESVAPFTGTPRESWDEGYPYWWDLDEVVCFDDLIPCLGNTGMWQMSDGLAEMVTAADELARRDDVAIQTPDDAAKLFRAALPIVGKSEGFFVLPLDETSRPKSMPVLVSLGTTSTTTAIQLKDVFAEVLKSGADRFIVAHNHPRGTLTPSADDIRLTGSLKSAAELIGLKMLDHLILGKGNEFSSVAEGVI